MDGEDKQNTEGTPAYKGGSDIRFKPSRLQPLKRLIAKCKRHKKMVLLAAVIAVLLIGVASVGLFYARKNNQRVGEFNKMNEALRNDDEQLALEHARNALAAAPNDMDTILAAANITKQYSAGEARELYGRAFEIFKKQENPDADGKSATTYYAAGTLAEDAGEIDQAKKYYQKAVTAADLTDSYDQYVMNQAQTALKRVE